MRFGRKKENKSNFSSPLGARGSLGVRGPINLTVPRNYSEMTEKQVRYIAALQVAGQPEDSIRTKCFNRFAGIKPVAHIGDIYYFIHTKIKIKGFFNLNTSEVAYFAKKMDWLTKQYTGIKPCGRIGRYKACDELLRDTTFIQYLDAENFYQAFLFTKNEAHLYKLIGTLYQKGKDYDNSLTESRAKYFARKATEEEKLIATMWMMGVKEYFSHKFKYLFVRADQNEDEEPVAPNMFEIMSNQIRLLTEGDITKKKQVLASLTWDALKELDDKCREAEEIKKASL